jgi:hypothetical protein
LRGCLTKTEIFRHGNEVSNVTQFHGRILYPPGLAAVTPYSRSSDFADFCKSPRRRVFRPSLGPLDTYEVSAHRERCI